MIAQFDGGLLLSDASVLVSRHYLISQCTIDPNIFIQKMDII
jgi:hypothetical protein